MPCSLDAPCGGVVFPDSTFNLDMRTWGLPQRRFACLAGHSYYNPPPVDREAHAPVKLPGDRPPRAQPAPRRGRPAKNPIPKNQRPCKQVRREEDSINDLVPGLLEGLPTRGGSADGGGMSEPIARININLDRRCKRCKGRGATESGLCLKCITKGIREGKYDHILKPGKPA